MSTKSSLTQHSPSLRFPGWSNKWDINSLKTFVKIYDGTHQTPNYVKEGVPFYSVEHITSNNFTKTKLVSREVFDKENKRVKLEKNDILMTRIGDIGSAKLIDWEVQASFYVSLALLKHSENINPSYLLQYINSNYFQRELWKRTIHVAFPKKINLGEIGECFISTPKSDEQQKIADFLSSVDSWIDNLRKQKESLEAYKIGITQKIFSQEIRFKDEKGTEFPEWKKEKLGSLLVEVSEKSTENDQYPVLSSTMNGICLQREYFNKKIASDNNTGYKILKRNQLVFSPQNLWLGNINICTNYEIGIVSPSYKIYMTNERYILINYLQHLIKLPRMLYEYKISSEQGASVVRRGLNMDLFNSIQILLPKNCRLFNFDRRINRIKETTDP